MHFSSPLTCPSIARLSHNAFFRLKRNNITWQDILGLDPQAYNIIIQWYSMKSVVSVLLTVIQRRTHGRSSSHVLSSCILHSGFRFPSGWIARIRILWQQFLQRQERSKVFQGVSGFSIPIITLWIKGATPVPGMMTLPSLKMAYNSWSNITASIW